MTDISNYLTYDRLKNKIYRTETISCSLGNDNSSFLLITISSKVDVILTDFKRLPPFYTLLFLPSEGTKDTPLNIVCILYDKTQVDLTDIKTLNDFKNFFPNSLISFKYYDYITAIIFLISKIYEYYLNYTINIINTNIFKNAAIPYSIDTISNLNLRNNVDIIEAKLPNFLEGVDPKEKYGIFYKYDGTSKSVFFDIQNLEKIKKFIFS